MGEIFLKLLNLSITASWLILAVLVLRLFLKKAPKWITCALWAMVAIRLICPFAIEADFSLVPNEFIKGSLVEKWTESYVGDFTYIYEGDPYYEDDIKSGAEPLVDEKGQHYIVEGHGGLTPPDTVGSTVVPVLGYAWLTGAAALLLYALASYARLKKSVTASIVIRENILACDEVKSPFILGIFSPVIYVPSSMTGQTLDCVITHETAHLKRHDHWWKPLGYLLLAVYWFNPLCWAAYCLLCRDIEMACDEKVIRKLDKEGKAAYSQALLNCSFRRTRIAVCPLAFGEVGVKARVRSVLNYKKPAFWIVAIALALFAAAAGCLLTNPKYQFLPSDAVIKEAKVDEYGLLFLITEDNELYIGGYHTDATGLYDYGTGQWGIGFDMRTWSAYLEDGAPVLFRSDVVDVFPGYLGFTWLGTDGMLYRFTGSTEGAPIVGDVKKAESIYNKVVYQTTAKDVFLLEDESSTPTQITTDAIDFDFGSCGAIRVLKRDGTLYSTECSFLDRSSELRIPPNARRDTVRTSCNGTTYISKDNTLYLHPWLHPWDSSSAMPWEKVGTHVIASSTLSTFVDFYVTSGGNLVQYRPSYTNIASSQKTVCQIDTDGLIKIEGCDYFVVALYEDGHYVFIYL